MRLPAKKIKKQLQTKPEKGNSLKFESETLKRIKKKKAGHNIVPNDINVIVKYLKK